MKAAIAAIAAIAGCGGSSEHLRPPPIDKHEEIIALWTQIRDWRREARIPGLDPAERLLIEMKQKTVNDERRVCVENHDVPRSCNDVCNLSDAICDNAEQICKIADELGKDDDFAQGKCDSAKASCNEGKKKCCSCSDDAPAAVTP